jgi:hypothetical protein
MNKFDLWEALKDDSQSNFFAWLRHLKLISFGVVTKVIDPQTVVVTEIVRNSASGENYAVTLLTPSSVLSETSVAPHPGDFVLLLFLQRYDASMFDKHAAPEDYALYRPDAVGYNNWSGIGILLSPLKGAAITQVRHEGSLGDPRLNITTSADVLMELQNTLQVVFSGVPGTPDNAVSALFGMGSPFDVEYRAAVSRKHGIIRDPVDNELMETDASVTEEYSVYAPVTRSVQGAQTTDTGLGTDKDGNPVETEAPVTETIHGKAPVTRNICGPQNITIGIGNDESGDAEEERDAPVNETYGSKSPITKDIRGPQNYKIGIGKDGDTEAPVSIEIGEKADVTLTSKSGLTAKFKKALDLLFEGALQLVSKKAVTIKSDSSELLEIGNAVATLGAMVDELLQNLIAMKTVGSSGQHVVSPDDIAKFTRLQTKWGQVFKK